jgi:hypothetical protein
MLIMNLLTESLPMRVGNNVNVFAMQSLIGKTQRKLTKDFLIFPALFYLRNGDYDDVKHLNNLDFISNGE